MRGAQDLKVGSVHQVQGAKVWLGIKAGSFYALFPTWHQEEVWALESHWSTAIDCFPDRVFHCEYFENLENPTCEITEEMVHFWKTMGVCVDAGLSIEQIIAACEKFGDWPWEDHIRLGYLATYTGFIEGWKLFRYTG